MTFALEFQPTVRDFRQLAAARRSYISLIVRRALAAVLLVSALYNLSVDGFSWAAGLTVVVAIMIAVPVYTAFFLLWLLWARQKPLFQVSIDEERICQKTKNHTEEIPWSSFVNYGSAAEFKNHFWLECGRGDLWIPKRAFHTGAEIDAFRQFVTEKMGDRCHFASALITRRRSP